MVVISLVQAAEVGNESICYPASGLQFISGSARWLGVDDSLSIRKKHQGTNEPFPNTKRVLCECLV